jgi:hypothetical protein
MIMHPVSRLQACAKSTRASCAMWLQHSCYSVNGGVIVVDMTDGRTSIATSAQFLLATTVMAQEYSRSRIWSWCLHEGFARDFEPALVLR